MVAGETDFLQAVPYTFRFPDVGICNFRHPCNRVHGRTDIMTHPGEEIRLGRIRQLGSLQRRIEHLRPFLQLMLELSELGNIGNVNIHHQINRIVGNGINTCAVELKPAVPAIFILDTDGFVQLQSFSPP